MAVDNRIVLFGWTLFFGLLILSNPIQAVTALQDHLGRAHSAYQEAMQARTFAEREASLNRALKLYSQLESEPGNGKLYYNIGNTYLQLEQYGWAILYFLRAQQLLPREDRVQFHLALTRAHQGIPLEKEPRLTKKLFAWHTHLSTTEKVQTVIFIALLVLFLGSYAIWRRKEWAKIIVCLSALSGLLLFGSLAYDQYVSPVQAVVVNAFGLYLGPDEEAALVQDNPFVPGTVVEVKDIVHEGRWLRVQTDQGLIGYIPSDVLRVI